MKWFDLIPVISYLSLKGKCRYCQTKIPKNVLAAETLFGLLLVVFFMFEPNLSWIPVLTALYINALSDYFNKTSFTLVTYAASAVLLFNKPLRYTIFFIAWIFLTWFLEKKEIKAIGLGDLDIFILLFLYSGLGFMVDTAFFASVLAIAYLFYTVKIRKKGSWHSKIPFLPFILLSFVLVEIGGATLWI